MNEDALRAIRDLIREREESLTFGDLSAPLLEDLAIGWLKGVPFASHVAEMLARIDGITARGRDRELAGRAVLTLVARRRAPFRPRNGGDEVRLLGSPDEDTGDPEAVQAFERRETEYELLSALTPEYSADDFAADSAGAFDAARSVAGDGAGPKVPDIDEIADEHPLALLGLRLPPGLRAWFHRRYEKQGPAGADARAWKFILASRSLALHRENLRGTGLLDDQGTVVPAKLLDAILATDLGDLAKTAVQDV